MKVLFCGTPGVQKKLALKNLFEAAHSLFPGRRIFGGSASAGAIPVIEDLLYPSGSPIAFLRLPQRNQQEKWREKFARIITDFDHAQTEHHFLGLHFTFRFEQIPLCPVDFGMLIDWKPDCIVTFIDDAYCVRQRVHAGGYKSFSLTELVQWRAEEALVGDLLARMVNVKVPIPNYVVSVKHPANMLVRLLLKPDVARVYMSYAITGTRNDVSRRDFIDSFRRRMHSQPNCAAFDPLTIDELPPVRAPAASRDPALFEYDASQPAQRWPALDPDLALCRDDLSYPITMPMQEVGDVREAIDAQVKNRDIRLVDQAHFLVVYRPTLRGGDGSQSTKLSSGVQGEIDHAAATGCPVICYVKRGEDLLPESPFADKRPESNPDMFYDTDETRFWERIGRLHMSKDEERNSFLG
jgi:hypothetical protein